MAAPFGGGPPKGYAQYTNLASAISLNSTPATGSILDNVDGAIYALIQAEGQDVRWRPDGTNPTASVGMLLKVNSTLEYTYDLSRMRFIQAAGGAILNVTYFGIG